MDMDKKTFMAMGILVATMAQAGAQTCPFEGLCEKSLAIKFSEGTLKELEWWGIGPAWWDNDRDCAF
jgi:hypothetical protein